MSQSTVKGSRQPMPPPRSRQLLPLAAVVKERRQQGSRRLRLLHSRRRTLALTIRMM
jgi:hypothetical protein